jgi:hypothetical protein
MKNPKKSLKIRMTVRASDFPTNSNQTSLKVRSKVRASDFPTNSNQTVL